MPTNRPNPEPVQLAITEPQQEVDQAAYQQEHPTPRFLLDGEDKGRDAVHDKITMVDVTGAVQRIPGHDETNDGGEDREQERRPIAGRARRAVISENVRKMPKHRNQPMKALVKTAANCGAATAIIPRMTSRTPCSFRLLRGLRCQSLPCLCLARSSHFSIREITPMLRIRAIFNAGRMNKLLNGTPREEIF